MAKYGTKYPVYAMLDTETATALPEYETGKVMGKLASFEVTPVNAEAKYYADDEEAESIEEFLRADGRLECDDITDAIYAELHGNTVADTTNEVSETGEEAIPFFGFGAVVSKMKSGVRKYTAHYYPKCKVKPAGVNGTTKGENLSFTGETVEFTAYKPMFGAWHYFKTFTSEADAKGYINGKLNITTSGSGGSGGSGEGGASGD